MRTSSSHDRSASVEEAFVLAEREVRRLDLDLDLRSAGPGELSGYVASLSRDGEVCAIGGGKGCRPEARTGAVFEALERYYTVSRTTTRYVEAQVLDARDVVGQSALSGEQVLRRWAEDFPDAVAACAAYSGSSGEVRYPLFVNDPRYLDEPLPGDDPTPYRSMRRYASSVGTAAGVCAVDARLHGLCELVEHDCISHALIRWFILGDSRLSVVEPGTLPEPLRNLVGSVAGELRNPIVIVDITNDLRVPAYVALCESDTGPQNWYGLGASPSPAHALARAVCELRQCSSIADAGELAERRARRLDRWPALRACMCLPTDRLLAGEIRPALVGPEPAAWSGPSHQLRWLEGQLHRAGIPTYARELAPADALISVVASVAPGLERFSLVLSGSAVAPTGRAAVLIG